MRVAPGFGNVLMDPAEARPMDAGQVWSAQGFVARDARHMGDTMMAMKGPERL